jgi:diguanylate cyclase (GGDEF)-like protein
MQDLIDGWLGTHQRLDPRFPGELETLYRAETESGRRRAMRLATGAGCVTGLVMAPLLWRLLPDAHAALLTWWIGVALPTGLICYISLWSRVNLAVLERWMVAAAVVVILCYTAVLASSRYSIASYYLGGMLLLLMLDLSAARLQFRLAALFASALVCIFAVGIQEMPHTGGLPGVVVSLLAATASLFALFGNWQLETESRRSYALMLRERLKRVDLSRDNVALRDLAQRDALTGLPNRRAYDSWLQDCWREARLAGGWLALVVIDVDRFKAYNDLYGHPAGDLCLRAIANCLREQCRGATDRVARLGGEEFAVLLPEYSGARCAEVAEQLRAAVARLELPHLGNLPGAVATISCGVASVTVCHGLAPRDLVAAADIALYHAKQTGRNRVCLADGLPEPGGLKLAVCAPLQGV